MFNLLHMQLRRLFRTRSFYTVLAVTAALLILMVSMMALVSNPQAMQTLQQSDYVVVEGDPVQAGETLRGMTQLDFICGCLGGGVLLVLTGIGVTLFVHGDFTSGYIKNICFARPRRWDVVLAQLLTAGVYSAVLVAAGVMTVWAAAAVFRLPLAASPLTALLRYAFWLWLPDWAFGLLGLALVLATRTATLGIILAIVGGGGVLAALLQSLCRQFAWPDLSQYLLSMVTGSQCLPALSAAQMWFILACTAGWGLVYTAAGLLAMEKRDL